MNDDQELDRQIRASLTRWAGSVEADPDLDALAARTKRPRDHRGTRVLGLAAAVLLLALAFGVLRGPGSESRLSTRADRTRPSTTESDDRGKERSTTSSTSSTPSTTASTTPNGLTTTAPLPRPSTDGSGSSSGPATSAPDGSDATGDGSEPGDGGPPTGCQDGGVALNGAWLYRVAWSQGSHLALVDLGVSGSTRRIALYLLSDAPEAGDCYIRITGPDGSPLVVDVSTAGNSPTEIHTLGCRNPLLVIPDGSTTDGVTWTFHVREINVTAYSARVVTDRDYTFVEGESGNIDFFRRLDCDDSTSI